LATANGGVNAGPFLSAAAPTALRQARKIFAIRTSPVATDNQIRAGADAAMGYPRFGMLDLLKLLSGLLVGLFRSHAAREAEKAFLRPQPVGLKRSAPARLQPRSPDRVLFRWLYRVGP